VLREFTLTGALAPWSGVAAAGWVAILSRLILIIGTLGAGSLTAGTCGLLLRVKEAK